MKLHRWLAVCAVLVACDSPTVPERLLTEVYDYRLLTPAPLVLRWPIDRGKRAGRIDQTVLRAVLPVAQRSRR